MSIIDRIFGRSQPRAEGFMPLDPTPIVLATLRGEGWLLGDGEVNVRQAMRNTSVYRCVTLISNVIGMLPLHLIESDTKEKAKDHPLFALLHREPNAWQTAFEFRTLMQMRALTKGNAYALVVWSVDYSRADRKRKPVRLIPLDPDRVKPKLTDAWEIVYEYSPPSGGRVTYGVSDILHLRGLSFDGIVGESALRQARDAIRLALDVDLAIRRLYERGSFVGGVLETPGELTQEAFDRLITSFNENYGGANNAGKVPLLEGGTTFKVPPTSAKDAQANELRGRQVEEIARVFGVPRPLLMVDETSWGSGIEALGNFFVTFGLSPQFEMWQQAIKRTLLENKDKERFDARFNPAALLRGTMKDQGEYLAKALGAGGHQPWTDYEEVRDVLDLPARTIAPNPMTARRIAPPVGDDPPPEAPKPKPAPKKDDDDDDE
ncbi:phage portal protein [Aureimonas leprariae]|uniref:Phage portal protein n=1 Tax=Plantimonas leprariae TaxID=2615207 RepID=A0A7V7PSB4_9HYPH|nr:phage portal protein [Aureimonas leprariae]KAB0682018.1 phage portal protein [Aureimonas leprariae]